MTKVVFTGPEDIRELAPVDLKKAGVEDFEATTFIKGQVAEVTSDAAKALVETDLFGNFVKLKKSSPEKTEEKAEEKREAEPSDLPAENGTDKSTKSKNSVDQRK